MLNYMRQICVIVALINFCNCFELFDRFSSELHDATNKKNESEGTTYALLIAGSSAWWNYRHQADVCHAYHVLRSHGIKEENIVTMMYDDIANNYENPYPGKIFNEPNGTDVYAGVKIDYTRENVTINNFFAVLYGNSSLTKGGNGRVLNSTSKDRIFIFYSDHGGVGLVGFPNDLLTVKDLNKALKKMYAAKRYKELVFYLESCESGSMFENILSSNINVYAMTAANAEESSWGCYCDTYDKLDVCLGDLFSVNWMQDSEKHNLHNETLENQYLFVKNNTNESHVKQYGTIKTITPEPLSNFQGGKNTLPVKKHNNVNAYKKWPALDIPLNTLKARLTRTNNIKQRNELIKQIDEINKNRKYLHQHTLELVQRLIPNENNINMMMTHTPVGLKEINCHHDVVHTYNRICFPLHKNPYAATYVKVLANLCEHGLDTQHIIKVLEEHCKNINVTNIL